MYAYAPNCLSDIILSQPNVFIRDEEKPVTTKDDRIIIS